LNKDEMVIVHHSDADAKMQSIMPGHAQQSRWGKFVLWYIPLQEGMLLENPSPQGMLRRETRGKG